MITYQDIQIKHSRDRIRGKEGTGEKNREYYQKGKKSDSLEESQQLSQRGGQVKGREGRPAAGSRETSCDRHAQRPQGDAAATLTNSLDHFRIM